MAEVKKEGLAKSSTPKSNYVNIAQSLLDQVSKAGQPRVSTTTTEYPEEPLNLMNLGMIAMMLLESMLGKNKRQGGASDFSNFLLGGQAPLNNPAALEPLGGIQSLSSPLGGAGTNTNMGSMNPLDLIKMLFPG